MCNRVVRFVDEQENDVRTFAVPDDISYEDLFFAPYEFEMMKARSRIETKCWRKTGFSTLLKDTFANPQPEAQEFINAFVTMNDSLNQRGMERHCSKRHSEERTDAKDFARATVFRTQDRLAQEGLKPDELADGVASSYVDACRQAKLFARRIAIADALSIKGHETVSFSTRTVARRLSSLSTNSTSSVKSESSTAKRKGRRIMRSRISTRGRGVVSSRSPSEDLYAGVA